MSHFLIFCAGLAGLGRSVASDYDKCLETGQLVSALGPLNVFFKLPITEISEVNDHKSQLTLRLAYKLRWPESRMLLNQSADWSRGEINVMPGLIEFFWTPDIIIHDLVRSDITIVCKGMQFSRFPLDEHKCLFKLSSFGYDIDQLRLTGKFSHSPRDQRVLQFSTEYRDLELGNRVYIGASKNYSIYGVEIVLTRVLSPYILSVYLPSAMFVVMSWVSFFIPPDIVPARIVLLVTLCLVLINMFNSTT